MSVLTIPEDVRRMPLKGRHLGARNLQEFDGRPRLLVFLRHFG